MAKVQFHRNQKVWVSTVGTWATIEKIVPVWARGFEEPVRITYDVGLGKEFLAHELMAEDVVETDAVAMADGGPGWRLMRARNKWQAPEDCGHHPFPGTFPVVVTDANDWGGWRTPGAEYDRDPNKIEQQARLIAQAPVLHALARALVQLAAEAPDETPEVFRQLAKQAAAIDRIVTDTPAPAPEMAAEAAE
jgi:hypothetical protein